MTLTPADTAAYLRRLGVAHPGPPSAAGLRALHAAHVERVPYEVLDVQLGRPTSIDPRDSARRIVHERRGGYCYHLNGALSLLLEALGYDVVWHRAGVQNFSEPHPPGPDRANHLALTVHGLPAEQSPSGCWFVDVGLGDALHEPLPLHEGRYQQGPFSFGLRPSQVEPGGWRFDHDPTGSFAGMDFRAARASTGDFLDRHDYLSTSPESGFVRTCAVQRRHAAGVDALSGCVLRLAGEPPRTIETPEAWYEALRDVFDLPLHDVDAGARAELWHRVSVAHEAWLSARAAS